MRALLMSTCVVEERKNERESEGFGFVETRTRAVWMISTCGEWEREKWGVKILRLGLCLEKSHV